MNEFCDFLNILSQDRQLLLQTSYMFFHKHMKISESDSVMLSNLRFWVSSYA